MKTCTQCGEEKPLAEYHRDARAKDGLRPACKTCVKAYLAEYYKANADRLRAHRATNVDRIRAQKAEHCKANADRLKAYRADYYKANVDRTKAQQAEYRAENPHTGWESDYRIRARKFGLVPVVESFTRAEMLTHWNNGERCIYCDGPFQEIDHMIPVGLDGHHVISNVAPSCGPCNRVNIWTVRTTRTASLTNA